jgi:hypothetical protein
MGRMEGHALELEPVGDEEREWLLDGLAGLIRRRGFETFVTARILRGRSEDFPDDAPKGPKGAAVLIRRLLQYAGMPDHRVRLQIYKEQSYSEFDHRGIGHAGPGTAAWFAGIEGDVCHFGVNVRELGDQEELIGTLGHEVAHAFRHHHGLLVRDSAIEERLTDLTAVYLGFGTFLLNSSKVFKTGGYSESGEPLLYQTQERGYLAPRQLALLLAAQVVARDLDRKQRAAVAAELTPNHRKLFEDACELVPAPGELRQRLGLPERGAWPASPDADARVALLEPEVDEPEPEPEIEAASSRAPGRSRSAQRIESSLGKPLAIAGGVLPFAFGATGVIEGWPLLGAAAFAAGLGYVVGTGLFNDTCSGCRGRLPRGVTSCPHCNASIVQASTEDQEDNEHDEPEFPEGVTDDADDTDLSLMLAMYAAWAIQREHVSESAEETHAELIVAVRCGERPTPQLALAWEALASDLKQPTASFILDYFGRRHGPASQDYTRLLDSAGLRDTPQGYARVADLLDSRLAEWSDSRAREA